MYVEKKIKFKNLISCGYFFGPLGNLREKLFQEITTQLSKRYHPNLGYFIKLISIDKIYPPLVCEEDAAKYIYYVDVTVLVCIPKVDQIIVGAVKHIDENGNTVLDIGVPGSDIFIPRLQYPADLVYNPKTTTLQNKVLNQNIKIGDLVKCRITEIRRSQKLALRATLKPNYGKV